MKAKNVKQHSLVGRLRSSLILTAVLFIGVLLVCLAGGIVGSVGQYNLGQQKVSIHDNLNGILNALINQETGLRGYVATNNVSFLEPFTSGHTEYLALVQQLQAQINTTDFATTNSALAQVELRANDWYNDYAQLQIKSMQAGDFSTARSTTVIEGGKTLFDSFRSAQQQLQQAADADLLKLQARANSLISLAIFCVLLLTIIVIVTLWRTFNAFTGNLHKQLDSLKHSSQRLGSGDLSARVDSLAHEELDQLGRTFNTMANALRQQQNAVAERLESILQLNSILTNSLDLKALTEEFLSKTLTLLDLQLGALYLYDTEREQLTLFAAQGLYQHEMEPIFRPGEGIIGRAAISRVPIHLKPPAADDVGNFQIRTVVGSVLPASLYDMPLMQGDELLGVLAVGSIYPMSEKAQNVLNVVVSTLSTMLSNTQAYQHIQDQAQELALRSREQELLNSELRRQRDELTTLNSALEEANRARSQFLSTMSHELRTPLASIIGFSQILLDDMQTANFAPAQRSNLERILKNGKHLLVLINDVLDLAKIEAGRMDINVSKVNVAELLSSLVEETQSIAIEQKLTLSSSVAAGIDTIETDPLKLRQILLNLISNALKFTHQGAVTVTATPLQSPDNQPERIAIAVKDTGIGLEPDVQERIFEAFFQVDSGSTRKFGGTGLGLSIVRQLITLLGGTIELTSSPGEGSTFTVTLPTKAEGRPPAYNPLRLHTAQQQIPRLQPGFTGQQDMPNTTLQEEATPTGEMTILVVDDNPDVTILVKTALANTAYNVVGIQAPLKVIQMAHELHPCAITLDVMMPDLNGWQILHQLKDDPATAGIPVVMLTVLSERTTGYVLGADDYLIKPFKPDVLIETLYRLVTSRLPLQANDHEMQPV
ncbi:MAG TPA: ATP-binding protein [Ktedonobacteraceae bacterium]|nr:ATP-binding protein [Ktedonobacteraceae bacterium]